MKGEENRKKYVALNIENTSEKSNEEDISSSTTADLNLSRRKGVISGAHLLKTLCFVLVWYFFSLLLTLLESPNVKLFGIILVISVGILFTVAKETEFQLLGFIFVMIAAVMSGFRWTMTQILLQKEVYGLQNPLVLMSFIAPVMAVSTGILSLIFEPWHEFRTNVYFDSSWHITRSCLLLLFGGTLAFFMVLTEYILVSVTSAVTVTIAGVVKEVVTITVAVFYFHDEFTWLKGCGLIIIIIGVSLFNWYKYQKLQKGDTSEDDLSGSSTTNVPAKYVILEEIDDQDAGI